MSQPERPYTLPAPVTERTGNLCDVLYGYTPFPGRCHTAFPDLANAGLKVMAAFIDGLLPYIVIKLLIGKKLVRMACKKGENIEFQTGKGIFHSMINDHEPAGINS